MADREKRLLTRACRRLKGIEKLVMECEINPEATEVQALVKCVQEEWNTFQVIDDEILIKHVDIVEQFEDLRFDLNKKLFKIQAGFSLDIAKMDTSVLNGSSMLEKLDCKNRIKLPKIEFEKFDGDFNKFPAFKENFVNLVHNERRLNGIEKLQHLRNNLRGVPQSAISNLPVTEANYDVAWDIILKRYDKPKYIVGALIENLLNQQKVTCMANRVHQFVDRINETLRGLEGLGPDAESRNPWLLHLMLNKCDEEIRKRWVHDSRDQQYPTIEDFVKFLDALGDEIRNGVVQVPKVKIKSLNVQSINDEIPAKREICLLCQADHHLAKCEEFVAMTVEKRRAWVAEKKLCFLCLGRNHPAAICRSRIRCQLCNMKHHNLLHNQQPVVNTNDTVKDVLCAKAMISEGSTFHALLATALIKIRNSEGNWIKCRALIDSGSEANFISDKLVQMLQLQRMKANVSVQGITCHNQKTKGFVQIKMRGDLSDENELNCKALILQNLPVVPSVMCDPEEVKPKIFASLNLADPSYHRPGKIGVILGAQYAHHILLNEKLHWKNLIAQKTIFGFVVTGAIENPNSSSIGLLSINYKVSPDIDTLLQSFWELEAVTHHGHQIGEECERHYAANTIRNAAGQYIVKLPFKDGTKSIGNSLKTAEKRFYNLERKLENNNLLKKQYHDIIREYMNMGHLEPISEAAEATNTSNTFYLPHHAVMKQESETTKVRIVFDGSCKSTTGVSLNDCLMIGPTIQPTLWSTLVRFREHKVALTADIEKILTRVTFGLACSSFLAIRTLQQISNDYATTDPQICETIKRDFYVDDLLTGAPDLSTAKDFKTRLQAILSEGGLPLRKWRSNIPSLCDDDMITKICANQDVTSKVLGLQWHPQRDVFFFKVTIPQSQHLTKRVFLSEASRVFDPLGWLSPSTILLKVLFQKLWTLKVDWDDELPNDIKIKYCNLRDELKNFERISIPRYISVTSSCEFHGFCDSSQTAYGAVVYCRYVSDGIVNVSLIAAKTKVTPLKPYSIARLELCAALLLTKLMIAVTERKLSNKIYAWSDSTTVLAWLSDNPARWDTFVGNRTAAILEELPRARWNYVNTKDNPADLPSRGVLPNSLLDQELWWHGPSWLQATNWNERVEEIPSADVNIVQMEQRSIQVFSSTVGSQNPVLYRLCELFSKWTNLVRCLAWVIRAKFCFMRKIGKKDNSTKDSDAFVSVPRIIPLGLAEINEARNKIIEWIQVEYFLNDINELRKNKCLKRSSALRSLDPIIGTDGNLRVGGRICEIGGSYDYTHPIILPKYCPVTKMIVREIHVNNLHAGPSLTFNLVRQRFWIVQGRCLVRGVVRNCDDCFKCAPKSSVQKMGNLPASRVAPARPFSKCGVDYAGPILLANKKGRGCKLEKGYITVFVCMVTKAIHLEVVTSLTTESFIAAMHRFISRRGTPSEVNSDNGTNFIGAASRINPVSKLVKSTKFQDSISEFATRQNVQWNFIPPGAPNWGGLWEAGVKSTKSYMLKSTKGANFTYEEMQTLLCRIEAILNSRPICSGSDNDSTYEVLTPAHFLIGATPTSMPEDDLSESSVNYLSRWQKVQQASQQFWKNFQRDYIHTLQQRQRWQNQQRNLQKGDVVLVKSENMPVTDWPLGLVEEVCPGKDGLVRLVSLRVHGKTIRRAINKICLLPSNIVLTTTSQGGGECLKNEEGGAALNGSKRKH